jgi:hypothetical protein
MADHLRLREWGVHGTGFRLCPIMTCRFSSIARHLQILLHSVSFLLQCISVMNCSYVMYLVLVYLLSYDLLFMSNESERCGRKWLCLILGIILGYALMD